MEAGIAYKGLYTYVELKDSDEDVVVFGVQCAHDCADEKELQNLGHSEAKD